MPATHTAATLVSLPYYAASVAPSWPMAKTALHPEIRFVRVGLSGRGRINSTVKVDGSPDYPVHRKVRLFRDRDGVCVGETWSDATTGAYSFDYVDEHEKYTVIAYDYEFNFRAVVADNLTPDLIP